MKSTQIVFALLVAAAVGEEFVPKPAKDENWQLVPDADGNMHLIDINNVDMSAELAFNATTDVIFRLWTRKNSAVGQIVELNNNTQLASSNFDASRETRFYGHGWLGGTGSIGSEFTTAFLKAIDCNVFVVDWGAGAKTINYFAARSRVNAVGAVVALYADWINSHGVPWTNIVAVGHSLGAHIMGAAGKRTAQKMAAVVGLDPAKPLFYLDDPANRLDATDAVYVESIVTDGGRLSFEYPVAHGNFYPNWGKNQPGCGTDMLGICGHGMSKKFYEASINNTNNFGATRCRGYNAILSQNCTEYGRSGRMGGEPVNNSGPLPVGTVFWLPTTGTYPYAKGPRCNEAS